MENYGIPCYAITLVAHVENKGFSVAYFDRIAMFEALYRWTSVKGGDHMCFVGAWISNESTKCIWALPLTKVQQYGTSKAEKRLKYATE